MKLKLIVLAISGSIALVGCGGGGGGGGSGSTGTGTGASGSTPTTSAPSTPAPTSGSPTTPTSPTSPTSPTVPGTDPNALQLTVPAPTYAAGSIELSAFTELNQIRSVYGVGQVAQNMLLDTAAQNHASYINARLQAGDYIAVGHTETAGNPGFTGVQPADRITYVKYAASQVGEDLTSIEAADGVTSDPGIVTIDTLMSGPYHRFSLLDPNREVGFGHASSRLLNLNGTQNTIVTNFGVAQAVQGQLPANTWVGVWPADQATGVLYSSFGEIPNPLPSNNGNCAGYPVSVQVRNGVTLATTTFTLVETASGTPVNVQLSTQATDANPSYARANSAYIMPYQPLKLATTYTAHFVGSQNGTAIDKTWSFTTRSDNVKSTYLCNPS